VICANPEPTSLLAVMHTPLRTSTTLILYYLLCLSILLHSLSIETVLLFCV